jgi:phage terminase small subunit
MASKPLNKLNNKHILFIERYIENGFNAAEAYRKAFKTDDLAVSKRRGWDLLQDPLIKQTISERQAELSKKYDIKKENIIKELVDIINFNVLDVQTIKKKTEIESRMNYETGKVEEVEIEKQVLENDLSNLTLSQQKNIKSIEQTKTGIKITYYDRMDAIEKLNKMLGFYEQTVNVDTRIDTSALSNLTFEQLEKLVNQKMD